MTSVTIIKRGERLVMNINIPLLAEKPFDIFFHSSVNKSILLSKSIFYPS